MSLAGRGIRVCHHVVAFHNARFLRSYSARFPSIRLASTLSTSPLIKPSNGQTQHQHQPAPKQARALSPLIAIALLIGGTSYYLLTPPPRPKTLNDTTFVPYTITTREAISSTSIVLTITPQSPNPSPPYLNDDASSSQWKWPLWSVEFKQPEVQISRHYTPLPPQEGDDPRDGSLKFYIRAVGDGEMSNYLCRRAVGQEVWLRGPHVGFELKERLGEEKDVVFLAGGTGIAPGMQAARAVLEGKQDANVDLLWAVRKREEVQKAMPKGGSSSWKFWQAKGGPSTLGVDIQESSAIGKRLSQMKAAYGDRLRIRVVVDEEGTQFDEKDLRSTLTDSSSGVSTTHSSGCRLHDQRAHVHASEFETHEGIECVCSRGNNVPGKKLLIVSGPDGFISHYAGSKVWLGGQQTQGPVGGVIGRLQTQNHKLAEEWLILKL